MTQKDLIKAEIERRIAGNDDAYARALKGILSFIDSLPDENNPEPYNPAFDVEYLNEKIAKAKKSWEGVNVDKYMDEVRGREPVSEDLDKAAEESWIDYEYRDSGHLYSSVYKDAFIAGAEWQKEQDLAEMAQSKSPLSVAYANRCFENGKQAMKEQMLKDAVEGEVVQDLHGKLHVKTNAVSDILYQFGDKVKVIILPKK